MPKWLKYKHHVEASYKISSAVTYSGWPKSLETSNNTEFDNLCKKNLEKPGISENLTNNLEKPEILYKSHG